MPANTTAQRLSDLITAVVGTGGDAGASKRYAEFSIRNDDANTSDLFGGNATVSSTNFGFRLLGPSEKAFGTGNVMNNIDTSNIWIRFTQNSQKFAFWGRVA